MKSSEIESLNRDMGQQLCVLRKLDELLAECKKQNLQGEATANEITELEKYIADMKLACNTSNKLTAALLSVVKDEEKAAKPKPKSEGKAAKPTAKKSEAKAAESEDDDLSFLD